MDIKKYIASGILEDYVLGLLDEEKRREVERKARQYPEIRQELQAIEEALEVYGRTHAIEPPAGTEERIYKKIRSSESGTSRRSTFNLSSLVLAMLLAVAGILAFYFHQQNQGAKAQIDQLQNQIQGLQNDCDSVRNQIDLLRDKILILEDPDYQPVDMTAPDTSKALLATVYWNPSVGNAYLEIKNLPPPPGGKQYQLWAIVDGNPTDMGILDIDPGSEVLSTVPFVQNAQAFAITLEDIDDDDPAPNLDQLQVIGNVS